MVVAAEDLMERESGGAREMAVLGGGRGVERKGFGRREIDMFFFVYVYDYVFGVLWDVR